MLPFGLVDVGGDDGLAHDRRASRPVLASDLGIDPHAHGGLLAAAERDQADAGDLRDLLREHRSRRRR